MPNIPISTSVWMRKAVSTRTAHHVHSLPPEGERTAPTWVEARPAGSGRSAFVKGFRTLARHRREGVHGGRRPYLNPSSMIQISEYRQSLKSTGGRPEGALRWIWEAHQELRSRRAGQRTSTSSWDWKRGLCEQRAHPERLIRREAGSSSKGGQARHVKIVHAGGVAAGNLGLFVGRHPAWISARMGGRSPARGSSYGLDGRAAPPAAPHDLERLTASQ
jgi:hypothetical protein